MNTFVMLTVRFWLRVSELPNPCHETVAKITLSPDQALRDMFDLAGMSTGSASWMHQVNACVQYNIYDHFLILNGKYLTVWKSDDQDSRV